MRWKNNQQQKFVNLVARVLQLTYAAILDRLIQEGKLNGCHGCVTQHLSQRCPKNGQQCLQSYWLKVGQFVGNLRKKTTHVCLDQPLSYLSGTQKIWCENTNEITGRLHSVCH